MANENSFQYTYSAPENQEVLAIRKKYLPREESRLEELKQLDHLVQASGVPEALGAGIGGALVFGLGFCLTMGVIGSSMLLGVLLEALGAAAMISAFPLYRKRFNKAKAAHTPRILQLAEELAGSP